jgi:hypothetical protein
MEVSIRLKLLIIDLTIGALVMMNICLLALIFCSHCAACLIEFIVPRGSRDANDPVNHRGEGSTRGIDEATLDSYPKMLYSEKVFRSLRSEEEEELEAEENSCCSICLSDYRESEVVGSMPDCGHMFHAVCIDRWLRRHPTCPVCRTSLISPLL